MRKARWALLAALAGSLLCASYLLAEEDSLKVPPEVLKSDPALALKMEDMTLELKCALLAMDPRDKKAEGAADDLKTVMGLMADTPKNPALLRSAAGQILWKYYIDKAPAQGAAQVSQVAEEQLLKASLLQIQQNQRIIELLEQIAKKNSPGDK